MVVQRGQERSGFNQLQRALEGVSAKMLRQQLVELEDDGIVLRVEIVSRPPKTVRYELTPLGLKLRPAVDALSEWGEEALRQIPVLGGDAHAAAVAGAKAGGHVVEIGHGPHIDPQFRHSDDDIGLAEAERREERDRLLAEINALEEERAAILA